MGNEWIDSVPDDCECYYHRGVRRPYPGCPAAHPAELGGPKPESATPEFTE
jgi:hypothetical protein